ncbi:MAG: PHP domain-containing protein [Holophagaceae bacterium]|nr:PHP domain-containing protein [Holophagaceae bacterium]
MLDRRDFLKQLAVMGVATTTPVTFDLGRTSIDRPLSEQANDGLFAIPTRQILRTKPAPRKILIPDVGEYRVLKGDFHIHTVFSDGVIMPKDRVKEAVDNGLDAIAITDHIEYRPYFGGNAIKLLDKNDDHHMAYNIALPEAEKHNLILVRGTEITKKMPPGHFNALFIKDANAIASAVTDWKKMLAIATDQGGFVHWNHPNFPDLKATDPMRFMKEHEDVYKSGHLHGIEVFNGSDYFPIVSQWCNDMNLALIANSDIHVSEWDQYGSQNHLRPMTLVLAKERSLNSIREAFLARRTIGFAAGLVFGSNEWLQKLFTACISQTTKQAGLELINKSDIPCTLQVNGKKWELPARGQVVIDQSGMTKLTVSNWIAGLNRPLEITLGRS